MSLTFAEPDAHFKQSLHSLIILTSNGFTPVLKKSTNLGSWCWRLIGNMLLPSWSRLEDQTVREEKKGRGCSEQSQAERKKENRKLGPSLTDEILRPGLYSMLIMHT